MIANIIVLAFIGIMLYWWGTQGFFSAILHLLTVIGCGVIAFGMWEWLAERWLLGIFGQHGLGMALLAPFAILLIIARVLMDRFVGRNVHFQGSINMVCGGACGLLAGVLTAGIVLIGLGFMPLQAAIGGSQRYEVDGSGVIAEIETGQLWVPVDQHAANFFTFLSGGSFNSGYPMGLYQPDLARQAWLHRLSRMVDPHSSLVTLPQSVSVEAVYVHDAESLEGLPPDVMASLGAELQAPGQSLVIVDTKWKKDSTTDDEDAAIRIAPTQVQLFVHPTNTGETQAHIYMPKAFVMVTPQAPPAGGTGQAPAARRTLTLINSPESFAKTTRNEQTIAWLFIVSSEDASARKFIRLRNVRLGLSKQKTITEPQLVAEALGTLPPPEGEEQSANQRPQASSRVGTVGERDGVNAGSEATAIVLSNALPRALSKNQSLGFELRNGLISGGGRRSVPKPPGKINVNSRITGIYAESYQDVVRLQIAPTLAKSAYGSARVSAAALSPPFLTDSTGERYQPSAYAWRKSDGSLVIQVEPPSNPIRAATLLPFRSMGANDELYLYFVVSKGTHIILYNVGSTTEQQVDLYVPNE